MDRPEEGPKEALSIEDVYKYHIGEFGRGQWRPALLISLLWAASAFVMYATAFAEGDPIRRNYWKCSSEDDAECMSARALEDFKEKKSAFCRLEPQQWQWIKRFAVFLYVIPGATMLDPFVAAHPNQLYILMKKFDLACKDATVQLGRSLFFAGNMIGAGGFGYISDRIGRHTTMYLGTSTCGLGALIAAFAPSFWVYTCGRIVASMGCAGCIISGYVLFSEIVGTSFRGRLALVCEFFFAVGECCLVAVALFVHSWRLHTLIYALLFLPFIATYWFVPQSPQWLLAVGKKDKAFKVLEHIAKANRTEMPSVNLAAPSKLVTTNQSMWEVVRHPKLLCWLLASLLAWAAACMLYYGVSLVLDGIPGDFLLNFFLLTLVEILCYVVLLPLIHVIGRKPLFIGCYFLGGIPCLLISVVPDILRIVFAALGKFGASGAFALAYLYTTEIFPTPVRNLTLGLSSLSARVGGMLAPQVALTASSLGSNIPFIIFGSLAVLAALVSFALPETFGKPLPTSIQDVETFHEDALKSTWLKRRQSPRYARLCPESPRQ